MDKSGLAFVDIGELGWSLYLSAHLNYLKTTKHSTLVMTSSKRWALYKNRSDSMIELPSDFYRLFKAPPDGFGLRGVRNKELEQYFSERLPIGYEIPKYFDFSCNHQFRKQKFLAESYEYSVDYRGKTEIIVFPRCRMEKDFQKRNLSRDFYVQLIEQLCTENPDLFIRSVGTVKGAYNIDCNRKNYINWVGKTKTIQELIDILQLAKVVVGSQSAPPKLALLQGIPAFMIGHQQERHMVVDNWMNTKAGFYQTSAIHYNKTDIKDCLNKTIRFVRSVIDE